MGIAIQRAVVADLKALPCKGDLTATQIDQVIGILKKHGATVDDFWALDEKPGHFGGDYGTWHWKLRQTRNRAGKRMWKEMGW